MCWWQGDVSMPRGARVCGCGCYGADVTRGTLRILAPAFAMGKLLLVVVAVQGAARMGLRKSNKSRRTNRMQHLGKRVAPRRHITWHSGFRAIFRETNCCTSCNTNLIHPLLFLWQVLQENTVAF